MWKQSHKFVVSKVAVITDGLTQATRMVLAQIFETNDYEVLQGPQDLDNIFYKYSPSILVVDDSESSVAPLILRELAQKPEFYFLPIVVLLSAKHMFFRQGIESVGAPAVLGRNASIMESASALRSLMVKWEGGVYLGASKIRGELARGRDEAALEIMMTLIAKADAGFHLAPALVPHLIAKGNLKGAERVLLSAIKKHPSKLSLAYSLLDLYLKYGHPELALQVITAISRHSFSDMLLLDLAQAKLLLGDVNGAIKAFSRLDTLFPRRYSETLGKLAFADGNEALAVRFLGKKGLQNYQTVWDQASLDLTKAPEQSNVA